MTTHRLLISWAPAVLFVAVIVYVYLSSHGAPSNHAAVLVVTNGSQEPVRDINVQLLDSHCAIPELGANDRHVCEFFIEDDATYHVTWQRVGILPTSATIGYVTTGADFAHELEFLADGEIRFTRTGSSNND